MENAILASEIFGMIALIIIMYGTRFESREKSHKKNAFLILVASVLVTLCIDAVSYLPLNWENMHTYHFCISMAAFICPFFVYSVFIHYIYLHITTKAKISKLLFRIGVGYCMISALISLFYGLKGKLFTIESGVYQSGDYYEGYLLSYVIVLIYTMTIIFVNVKKIGLHDAIGAVMFMLIPIIFIAINIINSDFAFSVSSLSISMMVINTMLQGEQESRLRAKEEASVQLAHHDELTGLLNRLAYSEECDKMVGSGSVGVVFSDVNGLKFANDHYGHKAGDELLVNYSEILLTCFRKQDVFRISGDEFVVIVKNIPRELFDRKTKALSDKINESDVPIASVGYVYGSESEINHLIDMAESKMYADKKVFHANHPAYGRGN